MRTTGKGCNKTWIFSGMLALVLAVMMILFCDGTSFISNAAGQAKVIKDSVNIRKEASTASDKVGSAKNGEVFTINSEVQGGDGYVWYQISGNGISGYIRGNLMEKISSTTDTPTVAPTLNPTVEVTDVEPVGGKVSGSSSAIRVRADASTTDDSNIITRVNSGKDVTVKGYATGKDGNQWYLVMFYGDNGNVVEGFISAGYVTLSGQLVPAKPATPPEDVDTPSDPVVDTPEPEEPKIYDTEEGDDGVWYLLDYTKGEKWDIVKLFDEQKANVSDLIEAKSAVKTQKIIIVILVILLIAAVVLAALLYFKIRDITDDAYFTAVEKETIRERNALKEKDPRAPAPAGRKVMQTVGADGTKVSRQPEGHPAGVKPAQGTPGSRLVSQNPAGRSATGAVRPANPQGRPGQSRPQNGVNPSGSVQGRGAAPSQARPAAGVQGRPIQNPRPAGAPQPGAASAPGQQRPAASAPTTAKAPAQNVKKRNFIDDDEFEFEFLNWDGDEK